MRHAFWYLLQRDLIIFLRVQAEWKVSLIFFFLIASLVPLGLGPELQPLQASAPALIWLSAVLSSLLSLEQSFRADLEDGSVEQILMSPSPLPLLVLAKALAHWLAFGLPLCMAAPILGLMLQMPTAALWPLTATLILGTPALSLLGGVGVALTLGLPRSGLLLTLLVLPLYMPILMFGSKGATLAMTGLPVLGHLALLLALLLLCLLFVPFATSAALRLTRMP